MSDSNRANDDKNTAANAPPLHSTVIQCNVHRANMHCTSISFHRAIVFACLAVVAFVSISFSQLILGLRIFFMFYWQAKTHNAFLLSFFDVCIFVFHSLSQYCCCFFCCLSSSKRNYIHKMIHCSVPMERRLNFASFFSPCYCMNRFHWPYFSHFVKMTLMLFHSIETIIHILVKRIFFMRDNDIKSGFLKLDVIFLSIYLDWPIAIHLIVSIEGEKRTRHFFSGTTKLLSTSVITIIQSL